MDLKKIGNFIAKCRKEKNLTQEQLGDILGMNRKTISKWENLPSCFWLFSMYHASGGHILKLVLIAFGYFLISL
jgi:hypothetical protein